PRPTLFPSTTLFRSRVRHHLARDPDTALVERNVHAFEHALRDAAAVAQDEEADPAQVAACQDPPLQRDALADVLGEVGHQDPDRSEEHTSELQSREN